jgi:hypothetical protein
LNERPTEGAGGEARFQDDRGSTAAGFAEVETALSDVDEATGRGITMIVVSAT